MKLKTKLKIKIIGNLLSGLGCTLGVVLQENIIVKGFFFVTALLAFGMLYSDFDKYPTDD